MALVATMRKMLVIIWTILTKNEPYSGEDEQLTERKIKRLNRISTYSPEPAQHKPEPTKEEQDALS